jgi:hypothetical protein
MDEGDAFCLTSCEEANDIQADYTDFVQVGVTRAPPAFICAFNSTICSRCIRLISRIVVLCPFESFSILKAIFVFSQVELLNGCTLSATWNSPLSQAFSLLTRAAFPAFAENSAWSIGFYASERITAAPDIPRSDWHRNEHTRPHSCLDQGEVVVFARPGGSGRLLEHIPIGEYRQRAYRVTKELLNEWGNIDVKSGYIQRSAFLPRFFDAERFLDWFQRQKPTMIARNNP